MIKKLGLYLVLAAAAALALFSVTGGRTAAQTPVATATDPPLGPMGTVGPRDGIATGTPVPEGTSDVTEEEAPEAEPMGAREMIVTRTPQPTATPDAITRGLTYLAVRAGMTWAQFLGLTVDEWINLIISLAIVGIAYLIGTWLVRRLLPRVVRRTPTQFDDAYLEAVAPDLRWLVVLLALSIATQRLTFLAPSMKRVLGDVYFVLVLVLGFLAVWKLIDVSYQWYHERLVREGRVEQLDPVLVLGVRLGHVFVGAIGLSILLSHFGINVLGLTAALGVAGLAFSLAAQDTLADAIAGFLILADRPFRVGDRIEIQAVGTWGDVVEIGLRTTRVRTRDNRMVIVPNSIIGKNEVVNYSYPDPVYRIETHVSVPYDTDVEMVRQLFVDAVRHVQGVLPDRPVDALYVEMAPSAMVFRVRWWVESYIDTRRMIDRVHTTVHKALGEAGIKDAYPTQNVNLQVEPEMAERLSRACGGTLSAGSRHSDNLSY